MWLYRLQLLKKLWLSKFQALHLLVLRRPLVGLGSGALSLVLQLGAGRLSYFLTLFQGANTTSTLLLGMLASLNDTTGVPSTPFVASPAMAPMTRASRPPPRGRRPCEQPSRMKRGRRLDGGEEADVAGGRGGRPPRTRRTPAAGRRADAPSRHVPGTWFLFRLHRRRCLKRSSLRIPAGVPRRPHSSFGNEVHGTRNIASFCVPGDKGHVQRRDGLIDFPRT